MAEIDLISEHLFKYLLGIINMGSARAKLIQEDGCQNDRGQKADVRGRIRQRPEYRKQMTDVRGQWAGFRGKSSDTGL
jgi:hypothetical protein